MSRERLLLYLALAGVLVFFYVSASSAPVVSDRRLGYIGGHTWLLSVEEGLARAQAERKPVLVYFWAVWCQYCKRYDNEVFPGAMVGPRLERDFVRVLIDLDADRRTPARFGVQYPPTLVFLEPGGGVVTRINGYVGAEALADTMDKVKAGVRPPEMVGNQTVVDAGRPPPPGGEP
ncbi:MAG: thioredoxin family protein [Euryarchaeota archaeon]|nr:thioredoxin family protein [Euryarchaeota archaeon]